MFVSIWQQLCRLRLNNAKRTTGRTSPLATKLVIKVSFLFLSHFSFHNLNLLAHRFSMDHLKMQVPIPSHFSKEHELDLALLVFLRDLDSVSVS